MIDKKFFQDLAETHYSNQLNVSKLPYGDVMFAMLELETEMLNRITVAENMQKDYIQEDEKEKAILMQGRIDTLQDALELVKKTQAKILK